MIIKEEDEEAVERCNQAVNIRDWTPLFGTGRWIMTDVEISKLMRLSCDMNKKPRRFQLHTSKSIPKRVAYEDKCGPMRR